jgi:hypothetical protein
MALTAANIVDGVGGLALAALGVWVLVVPRRSTATVGLGLFALTFGLGSGLVNLEWLLVFGASFNQSAVLVLIAAAGPALLMVAWSFPAPLGARGRRTLAWSLVAAAPVTVAGVYGSIAGDLVDWGWLGAAFALTPWWATLFVLARRWRGLAGDHARALALMTVALVLYPPTAAAALRNDAGFLPWAIVNLGASVALVALWLRNASTGPAPRSARNVALFIAAWLLVVAVYYVAFGGGGGNGAARVLSVALLAYAILRAQLLGIDVKVRWTLSKSTLAAVFIAVFFVASEAAQQFFGEQFESGYLGILAAGALVFAIAPLSRVADRIAAKAVPLTSAGSGGSAKSSAEASFAAAVRLALRHDDVSPQEERDLVQLAHDLGIPPRRAFALRDRIEAGRTGP